MDSSRTSRSFGRAAKWTFGIVAFAILAVIAVGVASFLDSSRPIPSFPRLDASPDVSLVGTVAYVGEGNCIRIKALSGASSREVYCLPGWSVDDAKTLGKPTNPQLVWLDANRLEVTYFRMTDPPSADLKKGWQFVLDVTTGARTDVADADVPSSPNLGTRPVTNTKGETISYSVEESGWATIDVTDASGTKRTVFREHGPGKYGYNILSAFWAPDGETIIVDDRRILVLVPSTEPLTRILVDGSGGDPFFGSDANASGFAVWAENLLP